MDAIDRQAAIDALGEGAMVNYQAAGHNNGLIKAIDVIKGLPSVQPERWIPCSERLPEIGQDVVFSVRDMFSAEGCLRDDGDWCQFRWNTIQSSSVVTAWMPLPEPYKGEQE